MFFLNTHPWYTYFQLSFTELKIQLFAANVTFCFLSLFSGYDESLTVETKASSDYQHGYWSPDHASGFAPGTNPEPDPGLIIYIDPFRIHACLNQAQGK